MWYRFKKAFYKYIEKHFLQGCTNYNSLAVRRRSRTKLQARNMFEKHGIPHAQGFVFINPIRAFSFVKTYGFPIVLKPNLGGFSRGSFFPIRNYKELWKALFLVKCYWPKTVIEQYLEGKNYRVTVCDGEIIAVARRYPPYVIGDGIKTIHKLIDDENETRKQMNLFPVMHPIPKDIKTKRYLKKQGHSLQSIPKKDQQVTTFHRIALSPGGTIETIDISTLSQKNKRLFQKILKLFDAQIFGIDVIMTKGIEKDYDQQECIFLEVNARPYMKLHEYPRLGPKPDLDSSYKKLNDLEIKDAEIL